MPKRTLLTVEVDDQGRFVLPREAAKRLRLAPGAKLRLEEDALGLRLSRSSENLARIYVEPTNQCNLGCVTCMRNVWDEPSGWMQETVFRRVLEGARSFDPVPSIFFGGFGEPLAHPRILAMVEAAHHAGAVTELITNGILLDEKAQRGLIAAGLDRLWVSLDGATPESYTDIRTGATLPQVIDNLRQMKALRQALGAVTPRLGIAFVAMRSNIGDLPEVVRIGKRLGADQFSITNVLPHTQELRDEMLYRRSFNAGGGLPSEHAPMIRLPRMEINALTGEHLLKVLEDPHQLSIARQAVPAGANICPFVEKGSVSVRWDGAVSPCLALLHTHESYLDDHVRKSRAFAVGTLQNQTLEEAWNSPDYRALRERLMVFDFSPCATCNSCEMADSNQEDCFGNVAPACGGCLWGQGFIQCP